MGHGHLNDLPDGRAILSGPDGRLHCVAARAFPTDEAVGGYALEVLEMCKDVMSPCGKPHNLSSPGAPSVPGGPAGVPFARFDMSAPPRP